ncbi:MAG TPA: bifunctional phosphoglucose/phosphomannose isomerase [Actinomycetota bacterium]|nr:bifunctional phosphoglucose/phosphomannose isomerase [Actinomycetota bacterium]
MADLADLDALSRLDSLDVLARVEALGDQCGAGYAIGVGAQGLPDATGVESIVVLGMGGSGVAGDVARAVAEPRLPLPMRVVKGYGPLPEWIGRNTLVVAVSYSGNTEETLAAVDEAHARGARVVAVSSGGALAERAREWGVAHAAVPPGNQPRASLGYLALAVLGILEGVGVVPAAADDVDETVAVLGELAERCHRTRDDDNPAKELARRLDGKIAVVYGGEGIGAAAAQRVKCDLNEYAKVPAFWNQLPEADHNEIVGWDRLAELTASHFVAVLLRDDGDDERVAARFELTRELVAASFSDVVELRSEGRARLARLMSLLYVGQLAAIHLAFLADVDPGPVEAIDRLKAALAQRDASPAA